ncbi:MAG: Aldehyde dehydrogenase [Flavobacteriales bacterium]|nr:MAG: Aldehyde dehydrogenase [Flavobacteriales bacterium]
MGYKEIDYIINSQIKFAKTNSNSVNYRIQILNSLLKTISTNESKIYDALKKDLDKHEFESFLSEILLVKREIRLFTKKLKRWSRKKRVGGSIFNYPSKNYLIPEPYGNTLIITPWNYPFQLSLTPLIGAVAAGNTVVIKPSELAPNTSSVLKELIETVFPQNLVSVIEGDAETAKYLLDKKWDYIFFTGSTRIGKIIAEKAAKNLTPITLELGGKSPCVVDSGIDINKVAKRIISGKFVNCGQTCIAPDYVIVNNHVKDELISMLKKNIISTFGNSPIESDSYGRIINTNNLKRLKKNLNNQNIEFGGKIDEENLYVEPTLIIDPDVNSEIMKDEIFGPILPILSYENENDLEKILHANQSPLAFYIFSKNQKFIDKLINSYKFGGCVVNDTLIHYVNPNLPFGGIGPSGMGAYRGKFSFDTFTHYKPVLEKKSMIDLPFRYGPYPNSFNFIKKILEKI